MEASSAVERTHCGRHMSLPPSAPFPTCLSPTLRANREDHTRDAPPRRLPTRARCTETYAQTQMAGKEKGEVQARRHSLASHDSASLAFAGADRGLRPAPRACPYYACLWSLLVLGPLSLWMQAKQGSKHFQDLRLKSTPSSLKYKSKS